MFLRPLWVCRSPFTFPHSLPSTFSSFSPPFLWLFIGLNMFLSLPDVVITKKHLNYWNFKFHFIFCFRCYCPGELYRWAGHRRRDKRRHFEWMPPFWINNAILNEQRHFVNEQGHFVNKRRHFLNFYFIFFTLLSQIQGSVLLLTHKLFWDDVDNSIHNLFLTRDKGELIRLKDSWTFKLSPVISFSLK